MNLSHDDPSGHWDSLEPSEQMLIAAKELAARLDAVSDKSVPWIRMSTLERGLYDEPAEKYGDRCPACVSAGQMSRTALPHPVMHRVARTESRAHA
jgi:hypothetical protein